MAKDFSERIINGSILLWERALDNIFSVVLVFPKHDREGDLALKFYVDEVNLYTMSFTIALVAR
jgi:hypothetical protein